MGYIEDLRQEEINDLEKMKKLLDQVIYFGGFEDGFKYLSYQLKSNAIASKTLIIRGSSGSGKKTLIGQLEETCLKDSIVVHLNPYHHTDDYSTLKYIGKELNLKGDTVEKIMTEVETYKKRIVIVLWNFEIFCRSKQGLLYCLTDLTQRSGNTCLIALTRSLDCTENLEKRVRSRLNTIYYALSYPYRNKEEYCEFASLLLGITKLSPVLKEQLTFMWLTSSRSIRKLKRYLLSICSLRGGKLMVNEPSILVGINGQSDMQLLKHRLDWLTRPQLDLLIVAISYCSQENGPIGDFTLQNLADYVNQRGVHTFDSTTPLAYKNIKLLTKIGLIKALKQDQQLNQFSKFTIGVMPSQLRRALEEKPSCHLMLTYPLAKKLN